MQSHSSHFVQDEQRKREESDQVNMKDIPAKGFGDAATKPKVITLLTYNHFDMRNHKRVPFANLACHKSPNSINSSNGSLSSLLSLAVILSRRVWMMHFAS